MLHVAAHPNRNAQYCSDPLGTFTIVALTGLVALAIITHYVQFNHSQIVMYAAYGTAGGICLLICLEWFCKKPEINQVQPLGQEQVRPTIKVVSWDVRKNIHQHQLVGSYDDVFNADIILLQGTYNLNQKTLAANFPQFAFDVQKGDNDCYCLSRKGKFRVQSYSYTALERGAHYLWLEECQTHAKVLALSLDLKNLPSNKDVWIPQTLEKIPSGMQPDRAFIGVGGIGETLNTFETDCRLYFTGKFGEERTQCLVQDSQKPFEPVSSLSYL